MPRFQWTERDVRLLRQHYPHKPTREVAALIGCPERSCYDKAKRLNIRKSEQYLTQGEGATRFRPGVRRSPATEFKPGQVPHNKGKKMSPELFARLRPTMFQKGNRTGAANHNYKPIGSLRVTEEGILERKVTDDPSIYPSRRWVPVARLVWEAAHGPVPRGHVVRFKDGMKTTKESEITIDRLECITKAENMRKNSIHQLPPELADTSRLLGRVTRQINKRARREKQTR